MVVAFAISVGAATHRSPLMVFGLPTHDFIAHGGNQFGAFKLFLFYFSLNGYDNSVVPWIVYFRFSYRVRGQFSYLNCYLTFDNLFILLYYLSTYQFVLFVTLHFFTGFNLRVI